MGENDGLGWVLTVILAIALIALLPRVAWPPVPGSAGRLAAAGTVALVVVTYLAFRRRIWPVALGGSAILWFVFTSANSADNPGG